MQYEHQRQILEDESPEVQQEILKQLHDAYWDRGRLRYLCLPNAQTKLYDLAHKRMEEGTAEPLVFMCHRRLGKSHLSALLCVERCLSQPGAEVWFTTDTTEHARDFLEGKLTDTFASMPKWISYRTRRNTYYFRNKKWPPHVESRLTLKGLDYQQGGAIRGGAADLIIVDEAREVKHLDFVIKRVLIPMFKGRKNPTMVILSTPAETLDHDFHSIYCERARRTDSFTRIPASENPDWTADDEKLMLDQYTSKDDIGWKREIECEEIPDTSALVIPEWGTEGEGKARDTCFKDVLEPPPHYRGYVICDMGYKDHTGMLFARHDFYNNQIQVIDELFEHYKDSQSLVELMLEKINKNFPEQIRAELTIKAETTALNLADFNKLLYPNGFYVLEQEKHDKDGALNRMRAGMQAGQIQVQWNCVELDYQLRNGVWNKSRKSFERSKKLGHCDLLACLGYLFRSCRWNENPTPKDVYPGFREKEFWNPYYRGKETRTGYDHDTIESLQLIFGRKIK